MSNIVPKNNEDGRLGRIERRWAELHAKLANVESLRLQGDVSDPVSNELHISAEGHLKLGDQSVALQGDLDQLRALLDAFLSETGDDGVGDIISSFGTTYDTLRELIDGLETLTSYAQISYVDGEITSLVGTITALDGRVTTNTDNVTSLTSVVAGLSLSSLTDVNVSQGTLTAGKVLKYDGSDWVAGDDQDSALITSGTLSAIQVKGVSGLSDTGVLLSESGSNVTLEAGSGISLSVGSNSNPASTVSASALSADAAEIGTLLVSSTLTRSAGGADLFTRVSDLESAPAPVTSLVSLSDVTLGTLTASTHDGAALVYNASSSQWEAGEVDIADLANTVDGLVAGGGAPSSGSSDLLQVSNGSGAFAERGVYLEQTQTGATFDSIIYSKSASNRVSLGQGTSGNQIKELSVDTITLATGDSSSTASTITATAGTLSFNGDAMASQSYVNSLVGSGVSVTGSTLQFEVSDGDGGLVPIGLGAEVNGSTLTSITPSVSVTTDLGSASNKFRHLYLSGNSLFLGDATISSTASTLSVGGSAIAFANQLNDYALSATVSSSLTGINGSITALQAEDVSIAASITSVKGSLSTTQGDVTSLQAYQTSSSATLSSLQSSLSGVQSELDATQVGAGLDADGAYTANTSATFISGATSLSNADNLLNDQLETVTTDLASLQSTVSTLQSGSSSDVTALQDEINATQSGAGLGTGGAYSANSSSNYIASATTLKAADNLLDAQIKTSADAISVNASGISTNASSISGVLARVTTLEANDLDDLLVSSASGALSYSSASKTITLTDASVEAGTATSLASAVELTLQGDISAPAVTFSGGGAVALTTTLSASLASTISNIQTSLSGKQDSLTFSGGVLESSGVVSLSDTYTRGLFSGSGDVVYNGTLGQFNVSTYKSADFTSDLGTKTTADLTEGSNLYYTDARVNTYLSDNNYATESYVGAQVSSLVDSAPGTLDTLNELAAALGDDPNFATTVSGQIGAKQDQITVVSGGNLGSSLSLSGSTLTFTGSTDSDVRGLFSSAGDIAYNGTLGQFSVSTYASFDSDFSGKSTSDLAEGANLYYTNARARSSVSASGDLTYDSSTGVFSFTERTDSEINNLFDTRLASKDSGDITEGSNLYYTDARARGSVSVTNASGDGSMSYNASTGVLTYTGPSAAESRAHFSAAGDLTYSSTTGVLSVTTYKDADFDTRMASRDTGDLAEGVNLYYTDARARSSLSASGDLTYDSSTGALSFTERTDAQVRGLLSVSDAGGDGSLSYDSSTGQITYTGPSQAEVRAHFTAGSNIELSSGAISVSSSLTASTMEVSGQFTTTGHILETFNHGLVSGSHSSASDLGSVTSDVIYHSTDLGGLDNGSFI